MATELTQRLGNRTEGSFASRVQYWLNAAYQRLALVFHHVEFDVDTSGAPTTVAAGESSAPIPTDAYVLAAVDLYDSAGTKLLDVLRPGEHWAIFKSFKLQPAPPQKYAQFGRRVFFQAPADAAYKLVYRYYRYPTAPDFSTGAGAKTPETAWLWDEAILEMAVALGSNAVWRPDVGQSYLQPLAVWMGQQVQPQLSEAPVAERPTRKIENQPITGRQG